MKKFIFNLSKPQDRLLKAFSEKFGIRKAEVVRRALDEYFYKERRKLRLDDAPLLTNGGDEIEADMED